MIFEKREKKDGAKWEEISFDEMLDAVFDDYCNRYSLTDETDHIFFHQAILKLSLIIDWHRKYKTKQAEYRII